MRALLFTLMLVPCSAVLAATVYKWVDQNGVTHYSDQPNPGAEKVQVNAAQSYSANTSAAPRDVVLPAQTNDGPQYKSCVIASPTNDEVFMNVSSVSGSLRLDPSLQAGHRVSVALDGKRLDNVGTSFTLPQIARGTHTLNLVVEDSAGGVVCSSPSVTFHVRQPSAQAPRATNRPRF
jgi:hypothetical protein